jgi:MFS-type transporter involved in bile tolerance (Atg22 family)
LFIPAASAVWALLPVVAAGNLDLGSAGYGLLLGMVGVGAVAGALVIPRLRARVGSARLVTGATFVTAGRPLRWSPPSATRCWSASLWRRSAPRGSRSCPA